MHCRCDGIRGENKQREKGLAFLRLHLGSFQENCGDSLAVLNDFTALSKNLNVSFFHFSRENQLSRLQDCRGKNGRLGSKGSTSGTHQEVEGRNLLGFCVQSPSANFQSRVRGYVLEGWKKSGCVHSYREEEQQR